MDALHHLLVLRIFGETVPRVKLLAMGKAPDTVKRLVDRFNQQADQIRSPDYNGTFVRVDFIDPFMSELGWDMDNRAGYAEQYREVVHEDRVKVAGQTKAPDYSFRIGRRNRVAVRFLSFQLGSV